MKTVTLNVDKNTIENAVQRDSHKCMIADALVQKFPTAKWVQVDLQSVRFTVHKRRYVYFTPPEGQLALVAFDQGQPVKPFEMRLTSGIVKKAGWAANHPGQTRKGKKYRKTRKKRIFPKRTRQYGIRALLP